MIVGAAWVLPVEGDPIRNGAVLVKGALVVEVGRFSALVATHPDEPSEFYDDSVLTPGLVNAHTHLSLTIVRGLVPPGPLAEWLPRMTRAITAMGDDEFAASAALGALESLEAGVTVVGDIVYGPEAPAAAGDVGVAGVFFWEVLGLEASALDRALEAAEFPGGPGERVSGRTRRGLSPHTPYTAGPALLTAVSARARSLESPVAIHIAESPEESALMHARQSAFGSLAGRLAHGFEPPHVSSVAYLDRLEVLEGSLAVHCVALERGDAELLAAKASGVVLCPRSNAILGNGVPPVAALDEAGATLGLGTDSAASNDDLDLLEEARALHAIDPTLPPARLLGIVTLEGARTLGVDDEFGSLAPGKQADLAVFGVGPTQDPISTLLAMGGRDSLQAVMTAGVWRIRRGRHTMPLHGVHRDSERARAVVAAAVGEG